MDNEAMLNVVRTSIMDADRKILALLKKKDVIEKQILIYLDSVNEISLLMATGQFAILKGVNTIITNTQMFREQSEVQLANLMQARHRKF